MHTVKRRRRSTKVCEFCKRRKVKCDVSNPCQACLIAGRLCIYLYDHPSSGLNALESLEMPASTKKISNTPKYDENATLELLHNLQHFDCIHDYTLNFGAHVGLNFGNTQLLNLWSSLAHMNEADPVCSLMECRLGFDSGYIPRVPLESSHAVSSISTVSLPIHSLSQRPPLDLSHSSSHSVPKYFGHDQYDYLFGNNLMLLPNDCISFYDGYCPIFDLESIKRRACGPFAWVTLIRADRALSFLWEDIYSRDKAHVFAVSKDAPQKEKEFSEKFDDENGFSDFKPYTDNIQCSNSFQELNCDDMGGDLGMFK